MFLFGPQPKCREVAKNKAATARKESLNQSMNQWIKESMNQIKFIDQICIAPLQNMKTGGTVEKQLMQKNRMTANVNPKPFNTSDDGLVVRNGIWAITDHPRCAWIVDRRSTAADSSLMHPQPQQPQRDRLPMISWQSSPSATDNKRLLFHKATNITFIIGFNDNRQCGRFKSTSILKLYSAESQLRLVRDSWNLSMWLNNSQMTPVLSSFLKIS